ncbi:type IV secretion system protein [Marilutibacter chinensis]|uniref:Type IV secretion system protein n=1 Tax=Marilutibacter chinensis TaxID=2912247 RepID=A0ABS9HRU1_9GAMM|nr:type IV secretion system protein [Lysobacter chinensis]MCF7221664.1 type IV secretion system protein [Lysobacter chinensis]
MTMQGFEIFTGLLGQGAWDWLMPKASLIDDFGDFVFFQYVLDRLEHDIRVFGEGVIGRVMDLVQLVALTLLTLWVFVQGYRVLTGQMREPLMQMMTGTLRAVLIVTAAVSFGAFDEPITRYVTTDMKDGIYWVITGEEGSPEDEIDSNLGWMQVAMSSLDVLETGGDLDAGNEKERAIAMVGVGTGGPALVAGALLLMYQVAMALFIGLGPIFILCLLFNATKSLFQRWLLYGIGTMFSMAVLAAMTSIALRMVTDVAAGMWTSDAIGTLLLGGESMGYSSRALQQGGMGLILTLLLLTVPPMAANFFQGSLGQFSAYATMGAHLNTGPPQMGAYSGGGGGGGGGYGAPPAYQPMQPVATTARNTDRDSMGDFHRTQTGPLAGQSTADDAIRRDSSPRDRG